MVRPEKKSNYFDQFTNLYSLSKTLRFELKPEGETLKHMRQQMKFDESLQTFFMDQEIKDAYQLLKPLLDNLHEKFISQSLESEDAKKIDFFFYFKNYKERKDAGEKTLEVEESHLRTKISELYDITAEKWKKEQYKQFEWKKGGKVTNSFNILSSSDILKLVKELNREDEKVLKAADKLLDGFFTYLSGFNQNRANYYEFKKEASTAVATRIVHENLPKFCDNAIFFENRSEEYLVTYNFLKAQGRELISKEGRHLVPIEGGIFSIEHFNSCLSQKQIEQYNELVGNANLLVNLFNQTKKGSPGFKPLQLFKILYKQIGCGKRDSLYFTLTHNKKSEAEKVRQGGKNAFSLEEVLGDVIQAGEKYFRSNEGVIVNNVPTLLNYLQNRENFFGIYWSKTAINTVSNKYFNNWQELKDKLKEEKIFKKADKGDEEEVKIPDATELEGLFTVIDQEEDWKGSFFKESIFLDVEKQKIIKESDKPSKALLQFLFLDIFNQSNRFLNQIPEILKLEDYHSKEAKELIKGWLDCALAVCQMLKYFNVKESKAKGVPLDTVVSQVLDTILLRDEGLDWFTWYDSIRNYLTKKYQNDIKDNKLKLNFENSTLANGWDVNKEVDNYCSLLKSFDEKYHLAIIAKQENKKGFNKIFEKTSNNPLYKLNKEDIWKKMEYKLLPGPNKMLPKCLLPKSNINKYGASEEILKLYNRGSFKKNEKNFSIEDLYKLIDFYKSALQKYNEWQCFRFSFKPTNEYSDIGQFYSDVEKQGYKLDFVGINRLELNNLVTQGRIYLFEIKNQDSNKDKKLGHRDNLHTSYWRSVFENIENRPKLNGGAEIFYRKALMPEKLEMIEKNGKQVIKNFRFSKEKFLFHVPVNLNFCLKDYDVNRLVKKSLSSNNAIRFLGIDRGEKHLAYYSLVDESGKIEEQGTLNIPFIDKDGNQRIVKAEKRTLDKDGKEHMEIVGCRDYNELLEVRAGDRDYARKNWQAIGSIKDLKEGYISQVVRKIADLAVEKNAFVILEDLNTGFKRGRQKIEKSVYQKLELALAKKLNFLIDKTAKNGEIGSVTKALQLTPPITNYGDIENRKQVGIMFYVRPNYTSQTDPVTGWRKTIYLKKGSEDSIKEQILNQFKDIGFDGQDYYFVYSDVNGKKWVLYSGKEGKSLDRFRGYRGKEKNEWGNERVNVVKILNDVFADFDKTRPFIPQIVGGGVKIKKTTGKIESATWESLRFAIEVIQQIRNTGISKIDNDFILSPVRDENGNHFDSRLVVHNQPNCGDANGAYNIARKGIVMLNKLKNHAKDDPEFKKKPDLSISDLEWDKAVSNWDNYISNNS